MKILLIDDDPLGREAIYNFLTNQLGHDVTECDDGLNAIKLYNAGIYPLVISDIRLPGLTGIEITKYIKKHENSKFTDIVLMTGFGSMDTVIQALKAGAYDYMQKPVDIEELESVVKKVEEHISLLKENTDYKENFDDLLDQATTDIKENCKRIRKEYNKLVGIDNISVFSESIENIRDMANKLHNDRSIPVLIEGETGTGKEVVSKLIHYGTGNTITPFIPINCTAIPESLFETELFGYEEGAFTDAKKKGSKGKFELAEGGTIFLDEIGDLPMHIQPKLLRVLEDRSLYRVGGINRIKLDVRIICATNSNLQEKVKEGKFREDLYYRLNVAQIRIPPLREQSGSIERLSNYFLGSFAGKKNKKFQSISSEAMSILNGYSWKGNVRELKNAIERVVFLFDETELLSEHLGFLSSGIKTEDIGTTLNDNTLDDLILPEINFDIKKFEKELVEKAIEKFDGNKTQAAKYLGLTRSALRSRL